MARLFRDAGADYLWSDEPSAGSIPLSFEEVFEKGGAADYWLIKYNSAEPLTYDGLRRDYEPYRRFAAFENGRVYACHWGDVYKRQGSNGLKYRNSYPGSNSGWKTPIRSRSRRSGWIGVSSK